MSNSSPNPKFLKNHPLVGKTAKEIAELIDDKTVSPHDAAAYLKCKNRLSQQARTLITLIEEGCQPGQFTIMFNDMVRQWFDKRSKRIEEIKEKCGPRPTPPSDTEEIKARLAELNEKMGAVSA